MTVRACRITSPALALLVLLAVPWSARATADAPFSDAELMRGFVLTVFGSETERPGPLSGARVVKKFTEPVRYYIADTARVNYRASIHAFLAALGNMVQNLVIGEAASLDEANMVIFIVDRADYRRIIGETAWHGVDRAFLQGNACSAVIAARTSGIERAHIYLVADEGFAGFSHCMVEEISQSLGPANDSNLLPDSIFNDESDISVFGLFDWFILNMLYDQRIRPGMTERQAVTVLPKVITDARARLTAFLVLPPRDQAPARPQLRPRP